MGVPLPGGRETFNSPSLFFGFMRWEVALIVGLALTAGCLGALEAQEGDGAGEGAAASPASATPAGETELVERTLVFTAEVDGPQVSEERVGPSWEAFLGPSLVTMDLSLAWEEPTNGFGVDVERPDGSTHAIEPPASPTATSVEGEVPDPSAGAHGFHLTTDDAVVAEDRVRLEATVVFEVPVASQTAELDGDGMVRGPITVEETEEGFRAETTYRANGTVDDEIELTVDTVNGAIHAGEGTQPSGVEDEEAHAAVNAWATGTSREEARERLLAIHVTIRIETDRVEAMADAEEWDDRGASADVALPEDTRTDASLDTTNGAVVMRELTVGDVVTDTTNGAITGGVRGEGELSFDTTNGAVGLAFTPTGDSTVVADTTNGNVELTLNEDASTGYEIHASTTNGAITEDMQEASLDGSEDEATLRTEGYADRSIQVTGDADTTNGNIHFASR